MHITRIDIAEPVELADGWRTALVSFHADDQHIVLVARADRNADETAFLNDALRQLRRLPEFRRSDDNLTFADGLSLPRCA